MRYLVISCLLIHSVLVAQQSNYEIKELLDQHQYSDVILMLDGKNLTYEQELFLIKALRQSGRTADALHRLETMWAADTSNVQVALALGETYFGRGQYVQAYSYFSRSTSLDSTNGYYHKLAGRSAAKIGSLKPLSLYHFEKALEIDSNDRNAAYQLAIGYMEFNEIELARSLTKSFVTKDSSDLGMLVLDSRLAYLNERPLDVIQNFDYLVDRGDTIPSLIRLYGSALYQEGRYGDSKRWLQKAIQVAPSEQVYYYLGMAYFKQSEFDSASVYLAQAIKESESPNLGEFYTNLALSLDNSGQFLESLDYYNEAYRRTENPNLLFRMAIVNEELRHVKTAIKQYKKFLELTPERVTNQRMYAEDRLKDLRVAEFMDTSD